MQADSLIPVAEDPLAERVARNVSNRTSGQIRGLQVQVYDGRILITGRCTTYYAKQLVSHAALETSGSHSVLNEIEVC